MRWAASFGLLIISLSGGQAAETVTPLACLNSADIDHTNIIDDQAILFYLRDGSVWKNVLPELCIGLKKADGFEYTTNDLKLCSNVQTINIIGQDTVCALGFFYPGGDALAQ